MTYPSSQLKSIGAKAAKVSEIDPMGHLGTFGHIVTLWRECQPKTTQKQQKLLKGSRAKAAHILQN